jgi:hypothetical protein
MDIQRVAHGDAAICGEKFPRDTMKRSREEMLRQQPGETIAEWQCRNYLLGKRIAEEEASTPENERRMQDMNPEGFWEMAFSVAGIIYKPQFKELLGGLLRGDFKVAKVVSQGLLASDPVYIRKVIYSIRHPRAVAKSQENLIRGFSWEDEHGKVHNAFEGMKIHTPEMFTTVTTQAARFFLDNPEIPVRFLHFEDLIERPKEVIDDMAKFVGRGDYTKAYDVVQPKLNRSAHEDVDSALWEDAEYVYQHFCHAAEIINDYSGENVSRLRAMRKRAEPDLVAIVQYMMNPKRNTNREKRNWPCHRARRMVMESMCRECVKGGNVAESFRKQSEATPSRSGVAKHWSEEPCLFECGLDLDRTEYLTVEQSIAGNFWKNIPERRTEDGTGNDAGTN